MIDHGIPVPGPTLIHPGRTVGRVLVALEGVTRRAAMAQALIDRGAAVIEIEDGLDLLELLGTQAGAEENRWYPDLLLLDARLPLMDGIDALGLVRTFDQRVPAALLVAEEDCDARDEAPHLGAEVLDRALEAGEIADRVIALRRSLPSVPLARASLGTSPRGSI